MKTVTGETGRLTVFALLAFIFFLALIPVVSSIAFAITAILWVVNKDWTISFRNFSDNRKWWVFIALYAFHIVSLLWTENFRYAFFDLQIKLAYIVCPLVFAAYSFSRDDWKLLRKSFVLGNTLAAMICFFQAAFHFVQTGNKEMLFYEHFSFFMHPSYFMMYLNLSMLFILYELFWQREENIRWRKFYYGVLFFQLLSIFMLSARTSLAVSLITFFIYCVVMVRNRKFSRKDALPIALFFAFAVLFQLGLLTYYNRYDQITNLIRDPNKNEENSTSIRYNLWKTAGEVIRENPVAGVGIGDIKEELVARYVKNNYEYGIKNRISPHNEYLHTAVILGAAGVILLLSIFLVSFLMAWKNGDWIYMLFIVIIALNSVTESILERQAGILFFAFFNSLFATQYLRAPKTGT